MDDKSFNIRVPKRWVRVAMIVGVTALIVAPLTAIASHSFTDVPDSNTFHSDIEWMKDSGVTKGCNPPDNTQYCPDDNVTRGQMAAFMNRFAGYIGAEDGTPAQADNATTADSATSADDADTVDGLDAADLSSSANLVGNDGFIELAAGTSTEVLSLNLTPGSYVIFANGVLNNNAATVESGSCELAAGGASDQTGTFALFGSQPGDREGFALSVTTTVAATSPATLTCSTSAGWNGNVGLPTITAISVQSESASVTSLGASGDGEN